MTDEKAFSIAARQMLDSLVSFASKEGFLEDIWIVGGAVRELFIGERPVSELDVAIRPHRTLRDGALTLASSWARHLGTSASFVPLDPVHQTARIVYQGFIVDISTLQGGSIISDLKNRDFRLNAMALPLSVFSKSDCSENFAALLKTKLIDPLKGQRDICNRTISAVSEQNLSADPLRVLRAYRFYSTLGFSISAGTCKLLTKYAPKPGRCASERITHEMDLLLTGPHRVSALKLMIDQGGFARVFPELETASSSAAENLSLIQEALSNQISAPDTTTGAATVFSTPPLWLYYASIVYTTTLSQVKAFTLRMKFSKRRSRFLLHCHSAIRELSKAGFPDGKDELQAARLLLKHREVLLDSITVLSALNRDQAEGLDTGWIESFYSSRIQPYLEKRSGRVDGELVKKVLGIPPSELVGRVLSEAAAIMAVEESLAPEEAVVRAEKTLTDPERHKPET